MHNSGTKPIFKGGSLLGHISTVAKLTNYTEAKTILDYGSGKGELYKERNLTLTTGENISCITDYWAVDSVRLYDPGVEEYSVKPTTQFDGVVSTDVLEHIPEEDINWVLDECFGLSTGFLYMNIASYPAVKNLPNGWNAHLTIKPPKWWQTRIERAAKNWNGSAYVFDITEKRPRLWASLIKRLGGNRHKLTRIEKWQ